MKRLQDKVIVIAGGTKGVGRAAAEEFAREGAKVVIGDLDEEAALKSIRLMRTLGSDGIFVYTDLRDVKYCKNLFDRAYDSFGRIDGFFMYSGVTPVSPLDTCDEATYDWVMDVNLKGCFFCCQHAIRYMRMSGGGSIVFTGSAHGWGGQKDRAAYACSKGGLRILMEHIAHQYASEHIRCNYFTLGWTPTDGEVSLRLSLGESEAELRKRAASILPMGRMCEYADYLDGLVYLMSDGSSMMTGSVFRITGGEFI
ncbi:MAG: SDR family oxidoreductase [Bacteroidales bacterium]|nr:SDR family oxidoreductase [Bacteroidales bacterium]